jgi:hypothetical protein
VFVVIDTYQLEYKIKDFTSKRILFNSKGIKQFTDIKYVKLDAKKYLVDILNATFYDEIRKKEK